MVSFRKILPIFSYIFHPIFIPLMATIYYLFLKNDFGNVAKIMLLNVVIVTIMLPILLFLLLKSMKKVESIMIAEVSERKIPLVVQSFLLLFLVRNSVTLERVPELHFFFLGAILSTIIALVFAFFKIKISIHMIGISALTLFIIGLGLHLDIDNKGLVAMSILICGWVASSRLVMKAHTFKEIILGTIAGFLPQLALLLLWL